MVNKVELEMSNLPSVLFVTCSGNVSPESIIKLVLNIDELPNKVTVDEGLHGYTWSIDNKYYTADVNLCLLVNRTLGTQDFARTVQGVVLYFDSNKSKPLQDVESWLYIVKQYSPEIKILLCDNIKCDEMKKTVLEWCVKDGFELVELEPILEDDDYTDVEDDFPETTGIQRIIQALNAHVWSNLVMKSPNPKPDPSTGEKKSDFSNLRQQLGLDESLDELLDQDDDFSQLFSQLSVMRERMSTLTGNERKDAAEQVVKAFWKAMGGDSDEF